MLSRAVWLLGSRQVIEIRLFFPVHEYGLLLCLDTEEKCDPR